jgi:hypothetical protein
VDKIFKYGDKFKPNELLALEEIEDISTGLKGKGD